MRPASPPSSTLFAQVAATDVSNLAWMSDLAYGEADTALAALLAERNWRPLGASELRLDPANFDARGYYAVDDGQGFVAVSGTTLAIAFRGSVDADDLLKAAFDQQDVVKDLRPLVHQALAWVAEHPEITTVQMTGQSLGAAIAGNFAAKIDEFPAAPQPVQYEIVGFGSPGSEADDRNDLTRSMLEVNHRGDPVPTDDLLDRLEHHGLAMEIDLPFFEDANSLLELAEQKAAGRLTEHDSEVYRQSTETIALSPLYAYTAFGMRAAVLGFESGDIYEIAEPGAYVLGAGGGDFVWGSIGADLIDGGEGDDLLFGEPMHLLLSGLEGDPVLGGGDDLLAGGIGSDMMFGGGGRDQFVCAPQAGGGTDRIGAFTVGIDSLDLRAFAFTDYAAQVAPLLSQGAEGATLALSLYGGEDVILAGLDAASLSPADVLLS